jgi:CRP-like cAMP-binding protein
MTELARIEKIVFLQSVDIFSFCKAEEVLRIAAIARERTVEAGEAIYSPGDSADSLYCVVRGGVRLSAADGSERVALPLTTFGVLESLSGGPRAAAAAADTASLLLVIEIEDFFDLLAHNIEIIKALVRHLIPHFRESS